MDDNDVSACANAGSAAAESPNADAAHDKAASARLQEAAMMAARSAVAPGERVLWAGFGNASSQSPRFAVPMLRRGLGFLVFIALVGFMSWRTASDFGGATGSGFVWWLLVAFLSGLFLLFAVIVYVAIRLAGRFTVYAVTDQRAIILNAGSTEHLQSFGSDDVTEVEVKEGSKGRGDLLFKMRVPAAQNPVGSVTFGWFRFGIGGRGYTPGFYGIRDYRHVADLIRATFHDEVTDTDLPAVHSARAARSDTAGVVTPEERAECLPQGDLDLTPKHAAGCGFVLLAVSALILCIGLLAGAGLVPLQVGPEDGPSHTVTPAVAREYAHLLSALFGGIGLLVALWRNRVVLHMDTRTYEGTRGFVPFLDRRAGTFDDFDRLEVRKESSGSDDGPAWIWTVYLVWKTARNRKPWRYKLHTHADHKQALALANRSARGFGITVDDTQGAPPVSSKGGYWVLIVILLVFMNSLFGGLHWRDEWTDGEGYRCVRRMYGLRSVTTYEKQDGQRTKRGYSLSESYPPFYSSSSSVGWRPSEGSGGDKQAYRWTLGFGPFEPPRDEQIQGR